MSDDVTPEEEIPPFEIELPMAFTVGGVRFEAKTLDDLVTISKASPAIAKKVVEIQQAFLAAGATTAKNAPDPAVNQSKAPAGDVPSCKHGLMNDVRGKVYGPRSKNAGKPYPKDFYCSAPWDAADKCDAR